MKKILSIIMILGLCITLSGCGSDKAKDNENKSNDDNTNKTDTNHQIGTGICELVDNNKKNNEPLALGTLYECDPGNGEKKYFYILEVNNDQIYLISDDNIGGRVAWHSSDDGNLDPKEPKEAKEQLEALTSNWSKVKVLMPTIEQIVKATNYTDFDSCKIYGNESFLEDYSENYTSTNNYKWLTKNLVSYLDEEESMYKYWTSSPVECDEDSFSEIAWAVSADGYISVQNFDNKYAIGVRPVILVKKTDLTY